MSTWKYRAIAHSILQINTKISSTYLHCVLQSVHQAMKYQVLVVVILILCLEELYHHLLTTINKHTKEQVVIIQIYQEIYQDCSSITNHIPR